MMQLFRRRTLVFVELAASIIFAWVLVVVGLFAILYVDIDGRSPSLLARASVLACCVVFLALIVRLWWGRWRQSLSELGQ